MASQKLTAICCGIAVLRRVPIQHPGAFYPSRPARWQSRLRYVLSPVLPGPAKGDPLVEDPQPVPIEWENSLISLVRQHFGGTILQDGFVMFC